MNRWTPLHLHTHYSLLDGLSKPSQVADRCSELGYGSCAVTDHGTISGAISFVKAMQDKNIKPILGCEFYLSEQECSIRDKSNRSLSHLVVLSRNKKGWDKLIQATSRSNDDDIFYFKPRLDLDLLADYCDGNLISFSGHMGSDLANILFTNYREGYNAATYEEAGQALDPDWKKKATFLAEKYREIFGKDNFFIEIQLIDKENAPSTILIAECLREVSKLTGISCVATADPHYPTRQDASDQRLLLCSAMKTTLNKIESKMSSGEDVGLSSFFRSNNYHIPSMDEIASINTQEEIDNSILIEDMCEEYEILGSPMLPTFSCPDNLTEDEYLRELCRHGWKSLLKAGNKIEEPDKLQAYLHRIKKELEIIQGANLSGYFLIVRDIVGYVKDNGWLPGPGRGSAAGCLVSYLVGITKVDPIEHDLLFERFYNAGRNTDNHVSLPDIDIDVPAEKRDDTIGYIRSKYGKNKVGQMITFGRLQGRGALKEVFRVHEACNFDEINSITKHIPQEHEISDQLEDMNEPSIIKWALINQPEGLKEWCHMNDDEQLEGKYSKLFEQAIRLEGTYKSQGKHAAGVVISSENLSEVCPMVRDKHGEEKVAGLEMQDLEAMGHVKFDVLGINFLDKIMKIIKDINYDECK